MATPICDSALGHVLKTRGLETLLVVPYVTDMRREKADMIWWTERPVAA